MEYAGAKRLLKERLKRKKFIHKRDRSEIWDKNKLFIGEVDVKFVLGKINKCKKKNYSTRFSIDADDNKFHIFKVDRWYIKYELISDEVRFVSVHKDESHGRLQRR